MVDAKNPVGSVQTSLTVLEAVRKRGRAGVTELATALDVTKGTIHNHLTTLESDGFIVRRDGKFELGLRFFEYGEHVRAGHTIYEIGRDEVDRLATETGELANILVEEHGRGFYLHRAKGEQALSLDTGVGSRVTLHNTGLGKAILAHLSEERVHEILDEHGMEPSTEHTITDRDVLFERLSDVRERGYAFDLEERAEGIHCVAAPVITNDETVHGAISVAGPSGRLKGAHLEEAIPELVQRAANVISVNLSYS